MDKLSLHDPLFATYAIAATLMILKGVGMAWLTVVRTIEVNGGFRSPEDMRAACWTVGSLILIFMTVPTLLAALGV